MGWETTVRKILVLIGAALFCAPANAGLYRDFDGWSVYRNDDSCSMMADYARGTIFYIDVLAARSRLSMSLVDDNWQSIEDGEEFEIEFRFGNGETWTGPARGFRTDDAARPGFSLATTDLTIANEISASDSVAILLNDMVVTELSLVGSARALDSVAACLTAIRLSDGYDPFATK